MAEKSLYSRITLGASTSPKAFIPGSRTYKGMSTVGRRPGSSALYDIALIKQDLINHFYIRQGERIGNPEFGCIIWDYIFDPLTETAKDQILKNVTDIVNYDPRVRVEDIIVSQYETGLQVECNLSYLPYNISEFLQFRFDQDNDILS
jgi:phage baseplate assembly protein W